MLVLTILISLALILFGRQLFWFFVGAVGFVVGMNLVGQLFKGQPDWMTFFVAILAGILGAMLAIFLKRVALFVAGFLAGGYILTNLLIVFSIALGEFTWLVVLIGGILGAILVSRMFDWAVILLSTLTGSMMVIQTLNLNTVLAIILFVGLIVAGIISQSRSLDAERRRGLR